MDASTAAVSDAATPLDPYALGRRLAAADPALRRFFANVGAVRDSLRAQATALRDVDKATMEAYSCGFLTGEQRALDTIVDQLTTLLASVQLP